MKIIKFFALVSCLAFLASACDKNGYDRSITPLEGFYSNELTSNETDESIMVLSFDDMSLFDINPYSINSDGVFINVTPVTITYEENGEEGMIYPDGHRYVDSIYFFKDDRSDALVTLVFHNEKDKYLKDSLQLFFRNDYIKNFVLEQTIYEGLYVTQPFHVGPSNESELDTTADIGFDANFNIGDQTPTKAFVTAAVASKWLGTTFLSTTFSYGLTNLYNCIFKNDDATVENEKKLNDILTQTKEINTKLENIQRQLKQLDNKFDKTAVANKIERRNAMYTAIHEVNFRFYNKLKDLRKDPALVADEKKLKEAIIPIIQEWGNTSVDGSPAYTSLKRVVNMIMENVSGRNMFQVYDVFVFNTHNWENEGYVDREDFRTSDLAIVAECCFLTKLFYSVNDEKAMIEENDNYLKKFITFFDNNQVVKNNDKCICQIADAHIVFEKKARRIEYENPTWLNKAGVIVVGDRDDRMNVNVSTILHIGQTPKFIKPSEAKAIVNAYGAKEDLETILIKYGCCEKINASPVYIPLAEGHKFSFPPKPQSGYYSQYDMPQWMDIGICTINKSNPNCYHKNLGRIKFSGEKGWRKERILFIKKTVFDTWKLSYAGWISQQTTGNWWNYDVITRY